MLKRRNFPFSRKFGDDSSSDDDFPVETPPNDTKLRLLRSNFNHDNHFFFKIAASKYYSSSPKNENERSLQLDHEIYRPDISPDLFRANRAIAEQEQNASRTNRLDTSCSIKNTANSLSPSRRKARILNPTALPTPSIKAKPANPQKLRDIVRRKSCHCRECGPLSRLEKKTMHLPPEPRKPRIRISPPKVSTPRLAARSPQNSKTPSSEKGRLRRGSVASSIFSKKPENDDFVLPQLSDIKTRSRNKTYDGPQSLVVPVIDNIEKIEEEVAKKPGKLERSDTRKISGKRSEKKSEKSLDKSPMKDKLLKNISIREVYAAKIVTAVKIVSTVHNKLKKVRAKRYSSVKGDTTTVSGDQSARTYDSEAKPYASITKENSRKNFSSEKGNSETARTSLSMISKEIPSLKSLTAADNKKSKPPLGAMQVEKVSKVSTLGFSLNKMKLRPNAASFSENRALSLPRLRNDSLSALTRKDQNTSQDSDIQKMTDREENNVSRENVKKIQIRSRGSQTHRGDSQTSRELRTSTTKDLMNESLLKNMRSIVESDKIVEKNRKKKKTARGPDVVWKNYMQSAFLAYKETAGKSKTSLGSQSYRITQD